MWGTGRVGCWSRGTEDGDGKLRGEYDIPGLILIFIMGRLG
jgi:hypothetical protein